MSQSAHILRLHKKIYRSILNDVSLLEKYKSKQTRRYEAAYRNEFRGNCYASTKEDLLKDINNANIVFFGDFHTFPQSQKAALRLLKEITKVQADKKIALFLECLFEGDQDLIDQFLRGEIDIHGLREGIRFSEKWPFPWESYKHILLFAKEHGHKVITLNVPTDDQDNSLEYRDSFCAEKLALMNLSYPNHLFFVFIGDHHLAQSHLPSKTRRAFSAKNMDYRSVCIFQNEPSIYWRFAKRESIPSHEVVKLSGQRYCIINSTPWIKLQSYRDWLEGNFLDSATLEEEDSDEDESAPSNADLLESVNHFANLILESLQISAPIHSDVTLLTLENMPLSAEYRKKFFSHEVKAFSYAFLLNRPLLLARENVLFVPSSSANDLAEAAALLVRHSLQTEESLDFNPKKNMAQLILHAARAYFGSKIVNPRRKCNTPLDVRIFLASTRERRLSPQEHFKRRSFQWALKNLEWLLEDRSDLYPAKGNQFNTANGLECARVVGSVLGEHLFLALKKDRVDLTVIRDFFEIGNISNGEAKRYLKSIAARVIRNSNLSKADSF